jgi:hypothetical protein
LKSGFDSLKILQESGYLMSSENPGQDAPRMAARDAVALRWRLDVLVHGALCPEKALTKAGHVDFVIPSCVFRDI